MKMSTLYLIGTPLGNLGDVTLRGIEAFQALKVFFAEDTREIKKLLGLLKISIAEKSFYSIGAHNLKEATEKALGLLRSGVDLGLVSDRGMPVISDPGATLVAGAREMGSAVIPIPGPSMPCVVMAISGFLSNEFVFLGFPSEKESVRKATWAKLRELEWPFCFFESPRRVRETIEELKAAFPQGKVFVAREATKIHETYVAGALSSFEVGSLSEQGEFTVAIEPGPFTKTEDWREEARLRFVSLKEWAKYVGNRHGVSSREVYEYLQKVKISSQSSEE